MDVFFLFSVFFLLGARSAGPLWVDGEIEFKSSFSRSSILIVKVTNSIHDGRWWLMVVVSREKNSKFIYSVNHLNDSSVRTNTICARVRAIINLPFTFGLWCRMYSTAIRMDGNRNRNVHHSHAWPRRQKTIFSYMVTVCGAMIPGHNQHFRVQNAYEKQLEAVNAFISF